MIRDAILDVAAEGRQVVLTGHSNGGVDISAALALYPELIPHVRAVVSIQSPFGGTPIASDVAQNELLFNTATMITQLLSGESAALFDLTYEARQHFLAENPYPEQVPTVSMTSSYTTGTGMPLDLLLEQTVYYMRLFHGAESDGLVPVVTPFYQARMLLGPTLTTPRQLWQIHLHWKMFQAT